MAESRSSPASSLVIIFALGFVLGGIISLTAYTLYQTGRRGVEVRQMQLPVSEILLPELLLSENGGQARLAEAPVSQREVFIGPGLVNFFASWCAPCEQEHPVLMRLASEQVPVYGVLYHDDMQGGAQMLRRLGSPYRRILIDQNGESAVEYGLTGVPETLLIDAEGQVRSRWVGVLSQQVWEQQLRPLYRALSEEATEKAFGEADSE